MFARRSLVALGLVATATAAPCDIYADGDTPCVAAHSTTRALYDSFSGALYQIKRGSDSETTTISPLTAGGVADASAQDTFCANTTCLITEIYDQSGNGNHLTQAPPGGFDGPDVDGYDNLASAIGAPVTLNGQKAYGVFVSPGTGYRIDDTTGVATGDESEGMYAVLDGTHYNGECCFDYGNAETSNTDTGAGHMEAIYYGNSTSWGYGAGAGPWIMVDMENNLFSGADEGYNSADPTLSYRFVTAAVKGGADKWSLRGANAASGSLTTYYSGARYSGYNPMEKEGSIILGIGGDNSNGAQGTFYEGVMTSGYPSDDTEASVQANIVAAGYAVTSLTSGPELTVGDTISLRVTTPGYTTRYIAHTDTTVNTQVVSSSSSTDLQEQASWKVVTGLGYSGCFSFESVDTPGSYIRHYNFALLLNANDGTKQFHEDATFCPQAALNGEGTSLRSWSYPTRYFRHYDDVLYAASNGGVQTFDATASFNNDVSFEIYTGFA
ncbi:alpha-L-arabinofuranosidase B [Aspergillus ibericus CBS 121593]|uniref:Alpha-L-arabinofuranosidase n=1 Tax=Aspergillus ibericus CBS 121593 TaxID=1448316 RepID=A0A395GTL6_9EURO|nr:alpha-L-arabinofuranosidase B [Aspergillus ibericus CBS 121593]RAK98776.1 alpha-L-arabinofuranosidase B [Aspergillus ibericus CBS 121593]